MRLLLLLSALALVNSAQAAEPLRDVKYDTKHERNVLDFWPAKAAGKPAPIYVWFHGGGFRTGDKSQLEKRTPQSLKAFQEAGYAVVTCNYPFLGKDMEYRDIVNHCARAVQFIRSQSTAWNIDPKRLCCGGISAGALISQFLGYHDDFAKPKAADPIARQSSRPAVVVGLMQPIGTQEFAIRYMDQGEAPLFLYTHASPKDLIHPPTMALKLKKKADELGIPCVVYGGEKNDLPKIPKGKTRIGTQLQFLEKHLPE
jgi:hypothetical protein